MQDYRKLKVWEEAHPLTLHVYDVNRTFLTDEKPGPTSQLRRAAVSVAANLAEGSAKFTNLDKARFFQIPLGPLHEVDYYVAALSWPEHPAVIGSQLVGTTGGQDQGYVNLFDSEGPISECRRRAGALYTKPITHYL